MPADILCTLLALYHRPSEVLSSFKTTTTKRDLGTNVSQHRPVRRTDGQTNKQTNVMCGVYTFLYFFILADLAFSSILLVLTFGEASDSRTVYGVEVIEGW